MLRSLHHGGGPWLETPPSSSGHGGPKSGASPGVHHSLPQCHRSPAGPSWWLVFRPPHCSSSCSLQGLIPWDSAEQIFERPKSALLKSQVVSLLLPLLPALRILSSTISRSLQPRLPGNFMSPVSPSLLGDTRSSRAPLLAASPVTWPGGCQCTPATSWIAYSLLCHLPSRCWGG